MTHTEPKTMIGYLLSFLQHNSFIGFYGSFITGLLLIANNNTGSITIDWMSVFSFTMTAIIGVLTVYAKILEIQNNRRKKRLK